MSPSFHPTPLPPTLPYELRFGVTGHRNLNNPVAVRKAVDELLAHVDRTLNQQNLTPLEWTIVSPLAKGADRIVADAVLKRADSNTASNARLEVISPFSLDEYRKDFDTSEDRNEFERLLACAHKIACGNADYAENIERVTDEQRQHVRNLSYLHVGQAVVDGCEIVIAVWNGKTAGGIGGTGDIVEYALKRGRVVLWIDSENPDRPPLWIQPIVAKHGASSGDKPFTLAAFPGNAKQLSLGYHQLAAYHRDSRLDQAKVDAGVKREAAALKQYTGENRLPATALEPLIAHVLPHFVRADQLAIDYQRQYIRATTGLFYLSAIAVTVVVGQILFLPHHTWVILFEILAMVGAVWLWNHCRREAWHEKWLQDRYLAERLRSTMFTLFLTDETSKPLPLEQTLPFYSGPQNWLTATVGHIRATVQPAMMQDIPFASLKRFLIDAWLIDQRDFHIRNEKNKSHSAHQRHRLGFFLFGLTLLMAVLHLFGVGHSHGGEIPAFRVDYAITFLAILLPVWGAAVHAINTQLEFDRIAVRSARMAVVLDLIVEQAEKSTDVKSLRQIIAEGEQIIGIENHEWWILLSFRKPILPT